MNDSIKYYELKTDTVAHTFTLTKGARSFVLKYTGNKNSLQLNGLWNEKPTQIQLAGYDMKNFLLINRGFHWVNEHLLNK